MPKKKRRYSNWAASIATIVSVGYFLAEPGNDKDTLLVIAAYLFIAAIGLVLLENRR